MSYRSPLEAAQARIRELEAENSGLREQVDRLTGQRPLDGTPPPATPIGDAVWYLGSRIMGLVPGPPAMVAYTGGVQERTRLRITQLGVGVVADHALVSEGRDQVVRLGDMIVAQLSDCSLASIAWPGAVVTRRLQLPARLLLPPRMHEGLLMVVTSDQRLRRIAVDGWRVVDDVAASHGLLKQLGFDDGPRGHFEWDDEGGLDSLFKNDGWEIDTTKDVDGALLVSLKRRIGPLTQMGLAAVEPSNRVRWVRDFGPGHPRQLYDVDGLAILDNSGVNAPEVTFGVWILDGTVIFRIDGSFAEARFSFLDAQGRSRLISSL